MPPAHAVLPRRVIDLPKGPVKLWRELQEPPAQYPRPYEFQFPPRGPVKLPERLQPPASAIEAAPAKSAAESARVARVDFLDVIQAASDFYTAS